MRKSSSLVFTSTPLRCHIHSKFDFDLSSIPLCINFHDTSTSLRFRLAFTSILLPRHLALTSSPRRTHVDATWVLIRFHLDIKLNALQFSFEFASDWRQLLGVTASSLQAHFGVTSTSHPYPAEPMWKLLWLRSPQLHFVFNSYSQNKKGKRTANIQMKREGSPRPKGKGKSGGQLLISNSTRQPDHALARTNERNETKRSLVGLGLTPQPQIHGMRGKSMDLHG